MPEKVAEVKSTTLVQQMLHNPTDTDTDTEYNI